MNSVRGIKFNHIDTYDKFLRYPTKGFGHHSRNYKAGSGPKLEGRQSRRVFTLRILQTIDAKKACE